MFPSIEFLKNRYDDFNSRMFGGSLPSVPIKLTSGRQRLGCFRQKEFCGPCGSVVRVEYSITVSAHYDLPAAVIEDILIHEMIHLKVSLSGIVEKSHGPSFIKLMEEINERYGRNVSVRLSVPELSGANREKERLHYVFAFSYKRTDYFLCAATTCVLSIYHEMRTNQFIGNVHVYCTYSTLFNAYRRTRSLKGYFMTSQVQAVLAEKGIEMEIKDGVCRPVRS